MAAPTVHDRYELEPAENPASPQQRLCVGRSGGLPAATWQPSIERCCITTLASVQPYRSTTPTPVRPTHLPRQNLSLGALYSVAPSCSASVQWTRNPACRHPRLGSRRSPKLPMLKHNLAAQGCPTTFGAECTSMRAHQPTTTDAGAPQPVEENSAGNRLPLESHDLLSRAHPVLCETH